MLNIGYNRRRKWVLLASAVAGLASSGTAWGQAQDQSDITVTARKVPESLLKAPLSVTSISGDSVRAAGLQSLTDLTRLTPNANISGGIAGELQGQISIRGISTLVRNIGLETGVGIYVDGVYVGRPENFVQHLLDVDRVEIARGPQGTEYGKNTIAGVINVQTVQPDAEPGAAIRLDAGNYDYRRAEAVLGTRLNDQFSVRGAVAYARQDGFYKHLSGGEDAGSTDLLTWRLSAKYAPTDQLSFIARWDGLRDRGVPAFFQADALLFYPADFPGRQPLHINNNRPDRLHRDSQGISLTGEWTSDAISLTSITAYRESSYKAALDDDQEQIDFVAADNFSDHSHFFSQELRLAGTSGRLHYLLGAYYFDQMVRTDRGLGLGDGLQPLLPFPLPDDNLLTTRGSVKTESGALFGRLDYQLTDSLSLSGGLRYTREKKRAQFVQNDASGVFPILGFPDLTFDGGSTDDDLSPSASLSYEIAPNSNLYARFSRGFKSAAYNVDIASSPDGLTASPEKATSYEVGFKTLTLDKRLRLNLAAFHTDYDRLQVSQVLGNGLALTNAGLAKIEGVEGELALQLSSRLRVEGNAAILDAHYKRFDNCGVPASVGGGSMNCAGKDLVLAPHFSGYGAVSYEVPVTFGAIFARADVDHRSTVYFEPTNNDAFKSGPRTLVNLRLGLRHGKWDISAWVRNLTDKIYKTYADDRSGLGVLRTASYGAPRTYGVSLSSTF